MNGYAQGYSLAEDPEKVFYSASNRVKHTETQRSQLADKHVIVVDDEPMLLELAAAILQPHGYRVSGYRSGEAALNAYQTAARRPNLVITDYAMGPVGQMTGLDLTRACRGIEPQQKILLLSGTVDQSVCDTAPAKPDYFMAKPYLPPQLVDVVKRLIH